MIYALLAESVLLLVLAVLFVKNCRRLKRVEQELQNKASASESLRVINHDYKNHMHVLMGYIETDRFGDAKHFINKMRTVPAEELMKVTGIIRVSSIASLIIGKLIEARELGISINIMPDSVCDCLSKGVEEKDYITVIGNLLQNSIDELEYSDADDKTIDLFINTGGQWSYISVMDNGRGIPKDKAEEVFGWGYTTKINNSGLGLGMVRRIAEKYCGNVEIESEVNEGTEVSVSLREK